MFKKIIRNFCKGNKGFTLAELMIVIVIIGILTAIAIPVYNISKAKAEASACQANLRMIDSAIQQYKFNNNITEGLGDDFSLDELKEYFSDGVPKCPSGGKYTVTTADYVTCDKENHNYRTNTITEPTPAGN